LAKAARPVGPGIAAVIATRSSRSPANLISSSVNTLVQEIPAGAMGTPVSGSITFT
jgi:hypothetical protein